MSTQRTWTSLYLVLFTLYVSSYVVFAADKADFTMEGWREHNSKDEPPPLDKPEASAQYMSLENNAFIKIKEPPPLYENRTYERMEVSFRYWIRSVNGAKLTLGVMPCNEFYPSTQEVDDYTEDGKWKLFKSDLTGDERFSIKKEECLKNFRIKLSYEPDNATVKVAIKDLEIAYFYIEKADIATTIAPTETLTNAATAATSDDNKTTGETISKPTSTENSLRSKRDTSSAEQECKKLCISRKDCTDFISTGVQWYFQNPTDTTVKSFRTPTTNADVLNITLENATSCLDVKYWVTEDAEILLNINGAKSNLSLTTTKDKTGYKWFKSVLCAADFSPSETDNLVLRFYSNTPNLELGDNVVAVSIETTQTQSRSFKQPNDYLTYWGNLKENEWHYTPEEVWQVVKGEAKGVKVKFDLKENHKKGVAYLYSPWVTAVFKYVQVKYNITLENVSGLSLEAVLVDENMAIVDTKEVIINETSVLLSNAVHQEPYMVIFKVTYELNETSSMVFSEIDVLDGCREQTCNGRGTCNNLEARKYNCTCDDNYYGPDCENTDYCKYKSGSKDGTFLAKRDNENQGYINGDLYCKNQKGCCKKEDQDVTNNFYKCSCYPMHYWSEEGEKKQCMKIGNCDGVVCPENQECDEGKGKEPCVCKKGYTNYTQTKPLKCEEKKCDKDLDCPGAECKTLNDKPYCYCSKYGYSYNANAKRCEPVGTECTTLQKHELGCEQKCVVDGNQYKCSCYDGYELTGKTTCKMNFDSNKTCDGDNEYQSNDGKCECSFGFVRNGTDCVHICNMANKTSEALDTILKICGSDSCNYDNQKMSCVCKGIYENGDNGQCKIRQECLKENNKCAEKGKLCIPNLSKTEKYECRCPVGTMENKAGNCVDPCKDEKSCYYSNSVCQVDYENGANKSRCICQPGLVFNSLTDGSRLCQIAKSSTKISFLTKVKVPETSYITPKRVKREIEHDCEKEAPLDISGCVDYLRSAEERLQNAEKDALRKQAIYKDLKVQLDTTFKSIFRKDFIEATIIDATYVDPKALMDVKVEASLQFAVGTNVSVGELNAKCVELQANVMSNYCVLPPKLALKNLTVDSISFCNSANNIKYCGAGTQCNEEEGKFSCQCKAGYVPELIIPLEGSQRSLSKYRKEVCTAVDACEGICDANADCVIASGKKPTCLCRDGFVTADDNKCIACQNIAKCENGASCKVLVTGKAQCICPDGWTGDKCETRSGTWIAIWVIAIIALVVVVLVIALAVVMIKKARKSVKGSGNVQTLNDYPSPRRADPESSAPRFARAGNDNLAFNRD